MRGRSSPFLSAEAMALTELEHRTGAERESWCGDRGFEKDGDLRDLQGTLQLTQVCAGERESTSTFHKSPENHKRKQPSNTC